MTLGVFLPDGAEITSATAAGKALGTDVFDYYGRPYKLLRLTLPPGETREAVLEYDVPAAAVAPGDGTLTYRLDATPQGHGDPAGAVGHGPVARGLRRDRPPRGLDPHRPPAWRRTTTRAWSRSRASASPARPLAATAP